MDEFSVWVTDRTVLFTSTFGLTNESVGMSGNIFAISFLVSIAAIHFTLYFLASNSEHPAQQISAFHTAAHPERERLLDLMKERIERANAPSSNNLENENAEKELQDAKMQLEQKISEKKEADTHANSVNAQQMTLNDELNAIYQTYTELCNTKAYKEQELKTEKIDLKACREEDDSMTTQLETGKAEIDKLKEEVNQIKKVLNGKTKENSKLQNELDKINKQKDKDQALIVSIKKNEAEKKAGTEKAEFDLQEEKIMKIKSRVSQLDAALTEIKAKATEEEKEKIVNALFDKHTVGLEVEEQQKILEDKMKQKDEIQREIQLQAERMREIENSNEEQVKQVQVLQSQKKKITIKLDALRDFHAQRDIKVRQDLAKEQELRNSIEGDIASFEDRQKFLQSEIDEYKNIYQDLLKKHESAARERQQERNKLEKGEHEFWLKNREMDRKVKDIERDYKALRDQLAIKSSRQRDLDAQIHDIHMTVEKRKQKEARRLDEMRKAQEEKRKLIRMRGPQGEAARAGKNLVGQPKGPAPIIQKVRHDSPNLSPITNRPRQGQPHPYQPPFPHMQGPPGQMHQMYPNMPRMPNMAGMPNMPPQPMMSHPMMHPSMPQQMPPRQPGPLMTNPYPNQARPQNPNHSRQNS